VIQQQEASLLHLFQVCAPVNFGSPKPKIPAIALNPRIEGRLQQVLPVFEVDLVAEEESSPTSSDRCGCRKCRAAPRSGAGSRIVELGSASPGVDAEL
jgi:hypothetical protein